MDAIGVEHLAARAVSKPDHVRRAIRFVYRIGRSGRPPVSCQ
jgi:hypothetical protein